MKRHLALLSAALVAPAVLGLALSAGSASATPAAATSAASSLASIACPSATVCVAVGYATLGGVEVPLAETWNGKAWTVQALPNPTDFGFGQLLSVSCGSTTYCTAVGTFDNSKGENLMLADSWNGKTWKLQATPAPADYYGQQLNGISCLSSTFCIAVGHYFQTSGEEVAVGDGWNGKTWKLQATPKGSPYDLTAVSCTSTKACTAVGSFEKGSGNYQPLVESWNGTKWAATLTAPTPKGSQGTYATGLSCPTAASCTEVGYEQTNTASLSVAEGRSGKTWVLETTPKPATKSDSARLQSVDCLSATSCLGVGYVQNAAGNNAITVDTLKGKAWKAGTAAAVKGANSAQLNDLTCTSATACIAVGAYGKAKGSVASFNLAETWNGKTWSVVTVPNG
jgi:hypothetical protein